MAGRLKLSALRTGVSRLPGTAIPPIEPPPIGAPPPKLGVVQGPGTITFTLNGVPRWRIDINRFAGTPVLTVKPGPNGETRITLAGARLPGTQLPADFVLIVRKAGPLGTPGDFTFTLGGFHAQVLLERWLAGTALLHSPVTLSGDICPLGAASKLSFSANGEARFSPDWRMEIGAPGVVTLSGMGPSILADNVTLKVLAPTDYSISTHPKPKRTLLTLRAGSHQWAITPEVTNLPIGVLAAAPGLFSTISIEAGEGTAGDTARELLATTFKPQRADTGGRRRAHRLRRQSFHVDSGRSFLRHRVRRFRRPLPGRPDGSHGAFRTYARLARRGWVRAAGGRFPGFAWLRGRHAQGGHHLAAVRARIDRRRRAAGPAGRYEHRDRADGVDQRGDSRSSPHPAPLPGGA